MATSEFWHDIAVEFSTIPHSLGIHADWHYTMGSDATGDWSLFGTETSKIQFEVLARRAASVIAGEDADDLLVSWFEALRSEKCGFEPAEQYTEKLDDGSSVHHLTGSIPRLCEASANFCRRLEARALQLEFEEKQRNDPRNWSPLHQQVEAFRQLKQLISGPRLNIPERLVRDTLAQQFGINAEEVTQKQIQFAVSELLPHYHAIHVVPTEAATGIASVRVTPQTKPAVENRFLPVDDNYEVVQFEGNEYPLTRTQSTIIRVLHQAYLQKRGSVGIKEIQQALHVNSGRMSSWFRGKNKHLYGKLIVQTASRNHYRLDL